jgi:hypothetical protein
VIIGTFPNHRSTVALLPHQIVQRVPVSGDDPYVKHLLSPKECAAKMEMFGRTESLFLNPEWKGVAFDAESLDLISMK